MPPKLLKMNAVQKRKSAEAALAFNIMMQKGEFGTPQQMKEAPIAYDLYWLDDELEFEVHIYLVSDKANSLKRHKAKALIEHVMKRYPKFELVPGYKGLA